MNFKEYLNCCRKDWVHLCYTRIIENYKDYEKISRNKIYDEIVNYYQDYHKILDICTYKELMILKKVLSKKVTYKDLIKDGSEYEFHDLHDKFLVYDNFEENCLCIPQEYENIVKLAIKKCNKVEMQRNDDINDILIGLMKIYGVISIKSLYQILKLYIDISEVEFYNHITNNANFIYHTYISIYDNKKLLIYEPYYYFEDELVNAIDWNTEYRVWNINTVKTLRYHQFDETNPDIKKFLTAIENLHFFEDSLYNIIPYYVNLDSDREELIASLKSVPVLKNKDLTKEIKLLNIALDNMPSARFKGATKKEYSFEISKEEYEKSYQKNYKRVINKKEIRVYRDLKEDIYNVIQKCLDFGITNKLTDKFAITLHKNNINFDFSEGNIIANLAVFHRINKEASVFERYMLESNIHALHHDYPLFSAIKDSYVESLFELKKIDALNAKVTLQDVYTKKEYVVTDIALSSADKDYLGNYIYSALVTIKNITFFTEYAFIYYKEDYKDILATIQNKMNEIKNVANERTRRFLACYILFNEQDNASLEYKELS